MVLFKQNVFVRSFNTRIFQGLYDEKLYFADINFPYEQCYVHSSPLSNICQFYDFISNFVVTW